MRFFDFRGWSIAYEQRGAGAPLVFLHNGGTSHAIWKPVVSLLSGRFETFALDLLGYGASSKPGAGYTLDDYAEMLSAFLDARDLPHAAVVGNCMGSAIALTLATRQRTRISALVLINPLTESTFSGGALGSVLRFRRRSPGLARLAFRGLERVRLPGWAAAPVVGLQLGSPRTRLDPETSKDLCARYSDAGQMPALLAVLEDMAAYAAVDQLQPGDGFPPICTIWGTKNRVLSAHAGRALNETLRPMRAEWIDGCGHLPMLERPAAVAATINTFLEDVRP